MSKRVPFEQMVHRQLVAAAAEERKACAEIARDVGQFYTTAESKYVARQIERLIRHRGKLGKKK